MKMNNEQEQYIRQLEMTIAVMDLESQGRIKEANIIRNGGQYNPHYKQQRQEVPSWVQNRNDFFNGPDYNVETESAKALKSAAIKKERQTPAWWSNREDLLFGMNYST